MNTANISQDKPILVVRPVYALLLVILLLSAKPIFASPDLEIISAADGELTAEPVELLSAYDLVDLVAPIALYPDDLLAIVLPAASYPIQIVQAARFLKARENDPGLEPNGGWDDSIIALLNYPEVIALLNEDLDWTWRLGEAVLNQESGLIAAVRDFRERARVAGNLVSDEHQIIEQNDEGTIEIKPVDPEVIYVPYYEPEYVTVYQSQPVYHYYPQAYPLYYYPYPMDYRFSSYFWGVTSVFSIGWNTHHLHLHHYGYDTHPYYSHSYYVPFYLRHPHLWLSYEYSRHYNQYRNQHKNRHHQGNQWQPDHQSAGSRPHDRDVAVSNWRDKRPSGHGRRDRTREYASTRYKPHIAEKSELIQRASITKSTRVDSGKTAYNEDSSGKDVRRKQWAGRGAPSEPRAVREVRAQSSTGVAGRGRERGGQSRHRSRVAVPDSGTNVARRAKVASVQSVRVARTKSVRSERPRVSAPKAAPVSVKQQSYASRPGNHVAKQSGNRDTGRRANRHR